MGRPAGPLPRTYVGWIKLLSPHFQSWAGLPSQHFAGLVRDEPK